MFGDNCAWSGVGRITVKSISVTMLRPNNMGEKKEWLVAPPTAALHALYKGTYKMYVTNFLTKCNLNDSMLRIIQHHKTTELSVGRL